MLRVLINIPVAHTHSCTCYTLQMLAGMQWLINVRLFNMLIILNHLAIASKLLFDAFKHRISHKRWMSQTNLWAIVEFLLKQPSRHYIRYNLLNDSKSLEAVKFVVAFCKHCAFNGCNVRWCISENKLLFVQHTLWWPWREATLLASFCSIYKLDCSKWSLKPWASSWTERNNSKIAIIRFEKKGFETLCTFLNSTNGPSKKLAHPKSTENNICRCICNTNTNRNLAYIWQIYVYMLRIAHLAQAQNDIFAALVIKEIAILWK